MKLKNIVGTLVIVVFAFASCDKISNPILPQEQSSTLPHTKPDYTDSSATSGPNRYTQYKLLLEDCMGNQCSNCPNAVKIADTLISATGNPSYYSHIIMMEENMGFEAQPNTHIAGYPSYAFATNYTSVAGNAWCTAFGLYSIAYPVGMINRRGWTASNPSSLDKLYPAWTDTISSIFNASPQQTISINIHDSCWVSDHIIGVAFQLHGLLPLSGGYNLVTLIVENPVVSWQEDDLVQSGYDSLYHHTNVLRGAFGNNKGGIATGAPIPDSVTTNGRTWTSWQTYDFTKGENGNAATWNMANCYIVAFVYNTANYEVMQAEMIKVE